ncbi:anoctamin-6 isoform X2 [Callorhinchus milii]|uniref:Anoctamin n=1 Tax=Callorhinchus milii TaxID=7868 RepID=A0A4W3K282_CALMI|nr:anoctamin-6 isoform X2 [Callorhinchus milii]|eukprot:gi/632937776/ref/XP_007901011.1/ PREDICTED: anoctamin-6 isoform X2 [Callorhinchus milii]
MSAEDSDEDHLELEEFPEDLDNDFCQQVCVPNYGTMQGEQAETAIQMLLNGKGKGHTSICMVEFDGNEDSVHFADGERRIDFVLAYEEEAAKPGDRKKIAQLLSRKRKRNVFQANLIQKGIQIEATRSVLNPKLIFLKLHAPWEVLCTYAEVMHIKLPLHSNDLKQKASRFNCITKLFSVDETKIEPEPEYFTAPFEMDKIHSFHIADKNSFFTPATRSRIVMYILNRCEYRKSNQTRKFGITKLLDSNTYKGAYPLHDCKHNLKSVDPSCPNERYLLYKEWANPMSFYKLQPLDLVRKYFGEKIGIYFAWLGFYTGMLAVAGIVGLACFIFGIITREDSTWSQEVCDSAIGGSIIMCPQCDKECTYWKLNITCNSSRKLAIFDNYGTLVYAVFMGIWVTVFLEFWKRRQAELEYEWDTVEFLNQEEQQRPEYEARCNILKKNPVTQEEELVPYSDCGKCMRVFCVGSTVLFWISLIIASVVGIIVYRLAVFFVFSANLPKEVDEDLEPFKDYLTPQMATSVTASLINFVIIMILNLVYERVAIWITDFELPRTQTEYENSLTMKMFLFQFVNYYSSCFYIAFFKGKVVGYPGKPVYWLGRFRNEECDPSGCLSELSTQLMIVMGGKAIWNNIQEVLIPWLKNLIGRYFNKASKKELPRWEQDYQLQPIGKLGLFYEYLEMVIQFGFATIFVASFPLAPLLALINNIIEIRVDAWKMTTQFRRILSAKAQDIGAWQPILQGVAVFAAVTNALIIAFTSDMIPRLVYYWSLSVYPYGQFSSPTMEGYINSSLSVFRVSDFTDRSKPLKVPYWFDPDVDATCRYRDLRYPPGHPMEYHHSIQFWHVMAAKLAFIIVMEHIVFLVKFILSYVIPDVPEVIKQQVSRQTYLTQKLLHESHLAKWKERGFDASREGLTNINVGSSFGKSSV